MYECGCVYHGDHSLDVHLQLLLLSVQFRELRLSGLQDLRVLGLLHLDVFKLLREKQEEKWWDEGRRGQRLTWGRHTYLDVVPIIRILHVLLCQSLVLLAGLVESLGQVGVLRIQLHHHVRVLDPLTQGSNLLQEPQEQIVLVMLFLWVQNQGYRYCWVVSSLTCLWSCLRLSISSFTDSIWLSSCMRFRWVSSMVFFIPARSCSIACRACFSASSLQKRGIKGTQHLNTTWVLRSNLRRSELQTNIINSDHDFYRLTSLTHINHFRQ